MSPAEYNRCVDQFSDGLFRFIQSNLRDEEQARDVVQETFTKLWIKVDEVAFEKAKSYLFTTAYRTMIDWLRREKKNADFETADTRGHVAYQGSADLNAVLHEALARLTEIQRTVVLLRDYEGYSYDEIAEIAGLNESQVKVYIYRARVALKNYLVSIDYVL
jgi:RNA polymerase sigma-70 factor (ECF subfamily)